MQPPETDASLRGGWGFSNRGMSRAANNVASNAITSHRSTNYFAKVNLYANSRLPPNVLPLKLLVWPVLPLQMREQHLTTPRNISAYPVICLAAQYSTSVYSRPTGNERETHVAADWRMGTKAMVIKSIPIDDRNIVVFAIRGSQTFMDWAVNLNSAPSSPENFLVLSRCSL